ncbi:right-handed parallel beta-helix repeat-containing protein [bacterium]|nr:right-handed parallel beta-helix repeat-containing protein [bacterium]
MSIYSQMPRSQVLTSEKAMFRISHMKKCFFTGKLKRRLILFQNGVLRRLTPRAFLISCLLFSSGIVSAQNWSSVSGGLEHTIAVRADGTLWAWGLNNYGQLGLGDITARYIPTQVGVDTNWSSVSGGYDHVSAVKTDGTLWAWGRNDYGQLGLADFSIRYAPVQVGADTNWSSVSCGELHTSAIKTDWTLWGWGKNADGQLGLGDAADRSAPTQAGTDADWSLVSCGTYHTVAVKTTGTLWVWGSNVFGQLGLADFSTRYAPTQVGADTDWSSVSGGAKHTLAVKAGGTLWAWGLNDYGQLGLGDITNRNIPVQAGADTNWSSVSGGYHTAAMKTGGTLWVCGLNSNGQLGLGDTTERLTPTQVGADTNWSFISGGNSHTLAIKTDGTLWAWGYNFSGQLGLGDTANRYIPTQVNNAPTLSWTGELGYESDGVNPETGSSTTTFVYRVLYTDADNDAPLSGGFHIFKGAVEITDSPFMLVEVDPVDTNYADGKLYTSTITITLATGTDYTYYFEAYDLYSATATGSPTSAVDAPDVSTFVSGLISVNTTWSAANSPYIVTANVAVAQGATLTVEPGVTVKFSTGTYLQIQGCLNAQGTSGNKIVFTSRQGTPAPGDWQYIKFNDTSDDAACVVSYADLKYSDYGFYCDYSSPTITYSTISYNKSWGIYCSQSSPVIKYNYVHNNGDGSDYTAGIYVYGSPLVEGNTISNNNKYGIACYADSPEIKNNTVSGNTIDGIYSTNTNLIVRNNTISDNGANGVWFQGYYVTLTNNRILDNLSNGIYVNAWGVSSINRNTVMGNSNYGINIFSGSSLTVSSNTVSYNQNGIYTYVSDVVIAKNNIDNSTGTYNARNGSTGDINMAGNWWGTTDTGVIDSKIYDYYDDFNYGKVLYSPIAASEIDIVSPNTAPALSWLGAGYTGYETDGINYEVGTTTTVFTYKVKYTDADGDAPASGYPKAYILKGGTIVQTLTMEYVSGTYSAGAFYSTSTKLSAAGSDYTYYFEAYDDHDGSGNVAAGPPTGSVDAPDVTVGNNSPTLTWVGTAGYESDGVNPDSGDTNTFFIFKVKYTDLDNDAPFSGYPRVDLGLDGWQTMSEEDIFDTDYTDGKIYKWENYLDTTRDGYFFMAYDANSNIASGEATAQKGGPAVSSPGSYAIYGYILNHSSNPIANIEVGLYDNSVSPPSRIQYQITNSYGYYGFNSIQGGSNVSVSAEDTNYTWSHGIDGTTGLWSDMRVDFFGTAAGADTYAISGYCYDSNSNPFGSVEVYLYYGGTTYCNTYTDNNGYFSLAGVPGGNYNLYAQSGGSNLHIGDGSTFCYSYEPLGGNKNGQNFYFGSAVFQQNDFKVYGNVFDPRTSGCAIKFSAAANDSVEVKIYDTGGRLVRNFTKTTGIFSWNGRDNSGSVVANGVYYIHIKSAAIDETHPVAIFKP